MLTATQLHMHSVHFSALSWSRLSSLLSSCLLRHFNLIPDVCDFPACFTLYNCIQHVHCNQTRSFNMNLSYLFLFHSIYFRLYWCLVLFFILAVFLWLFHRFSLLYLFTLFIVIRCICSPAYELTFFCFETFRFRISFSIWYLFCIKYIFLFLIQSEYTFIHKMCILSYLLVNQ